MSKTTMRVYLIPGFFGFVNLGELAYFSHVKKFLKERLKEKGASAVVHTVHTAPTASIRTRTERLLKTIEATAKNEKDPIVLVGHSTGGLDARLLVTPEVSLAGDLNAEPVAERVRSIVTVNTPHYGTPLAAFFSSLLGAQLLKLFSIVTVYIIRFGRLPLSLFLKIGALMARLDNHAGFDKSIVDQIFEQLLGDFSKDRSEAVKEFLEDLSDDQSLFTQLDPEGIDLFNAAAADRTSVRYGCVVTAADKPSLKTVSSVGLDPYAQASHGLFTTLHTICAMSAAKFRGELTERQRDKISASLGTLPDDTLNDGIIPSLSHVWGEVIHVARGDHLDVIGHFNAAEHDPPHYDWLVCGAPFYRGEFESLWQSVADFIKP